MRGPAHAIVVWCLLLSAVLARPAGASGGAPVPAPAAAARSERGDSPSHAAGHHASLRGVDAADYLTLNVAVSDAGVEPEALFVPAGRPVQLMLRNRGRVEHHYHVAGLVPQDVGWRVRPDDGAAAADPDDHSAHHARRFVRAREASPGGIRPSGRDVHAYAAAAGDVDIVLFVAHEAGTYTVRCDLHDEVIGTLTVIDPDRPGEDGGSTASDRLARTITRPLGVVDFPGAPGVGVEATYVTEAFAARVLGGSAIAATLQPDAHVAFLVTERTHQANLTPEPVAPVLEIDGRRVSLVDATVMTGSAHHRATLYRYTREPSFGFGHHEMHLRLPPELCGGTGGEATWHVPLFVSALAETGGDGGSGHRWGLILALLGGMVAAMWPCLFQLTVYFIPALAGVAMQEHADGSDPGRRRRVLTAAGYFILGFTLVYTATGAIIGYAAAHVGQTGEFEVWQRAIGVAAGVVVIGLALRVAAKVRAPLVCRMPLLSYMTRSKQPATRIEMMLAGLAFATGCMTCFGSALVVGMVVYVGLAQSALYGALILFLFSLGMGIPLVAAALAMARALPLLMKLETAVPWMGLASAALMAGFGVLLISGNYMLVSEWTFRIVTGTASFPGGAAGALRAAAAIAALCGTAWVIRRLRAAARHPVPSV